jgi:hypothetical protein
MGELYDFKSYQKRKSKYKEMESKDSRLIVAIYRSVVYYVHMYSKKTYDHPLEHMTTNVRLKNLYQNDKEKFLDSYAALIRHWEIPPHFAEEFKDVDVFVRFPTVGHLCAHIEKRVKDL